MSSLTLAPLPDRFVVAQLPPEADAKHMPDPGASLTAIIYTQDEITVICPEGAAIAEARIESGWRALKIVEILDFNLVGVLAKIAAVLAEAGVSIFVLSTYNTDYILIKDQSFKSAIHTLRLAGYTIQENSD